MLGRLSSRVALASQRSAAAALRPGCGSAYFVAFGTDKAEHAGTSLRADTRPAHVEFLKEGSENVKVLHAGPTLDGNGHMNGSMLVLESDSVDFVHAYRHNDPHKQVGRFESMEVRGWA